MNRRRCLGFVFGSAFVAAGLVGASGCSEDPAQPSRGTISPPRRDGGGKEDAAAPPAKDKSAKPAGPKDGGL
ncbi:hypothetical protein OJF2_27670 [Aquisphaera giovannonii]|uniref:Lipoprotein n=1 Tax=Aquisphaera giovannonii TaxID=406548 RepID=A0A5B9W0R0_9BACT|nr:hypothetical protein [Aquisphaera giovannonii]QEH34232.1 hypothetical protein OJF2_27670 [Aquisphaera giovannonii]